MRSSRPLWNGTAWNEGELPIFADLHQELSFEQLRKWGRVNMIMPTPMSANPENLMKIGPVKGGGEREQGKKKNILHQQSHNDWKTTIGQRILRKGRIAEERIL